MKVKNIMTKNVITLRPDDTLHKALKTFTEKGISGAPVVKDGNLLGMVTERDILKVIDIYTPKIHFTSMPHFFLVLAGLKSKTKAAELKKKVMAASKLTIDGFMVTEAIVIDKDEDIIEAVRMIDVHNINRLTVVDGKRIVGIVTRNDLIKAVAKLDGELCKDKK